MKAIPLFIFAIVISSSCSDFSDQKHIYIDPELKPLYDSFVTDASKYGIVVSPNTLTLTIKSLSSLNYCGLTKNDINTVYIDTASFCWHTNSKELVYHELGHFILHRSHDDSMINGRFKSLMLSTGYILNLSDYYIEELFNPLTNKTPDPYDSVQLQINPGTIHQRYTIVHQGTQSQH